MLKIRYLGTPPPGRCRRPEDRHERSVAGREDSLATGRRECTDGARSRLPPAARQGEPGRRDAIVRGAAKVSGKVFRLP